jgi:fumarate reductase (CoM/CoB) subunit A
LTSPETTDCHVLVIGAGGAGVRAAIEASGYGETILLSKAIAGKGGCTPMAEGGYNAVLRAQDSVEAHFRETLESASGTCCEGEPSSTSRRMARSPSAISAARSTPGPATPATARATRS